MKLLFDENISYRVVKLIADSVPESIHVSRSGITRPQSDRDIWNYAKFNNFVIVSFDEDFKDLSSVYGFPPKVILLRTGNTSTKYISDLIRRRLPEILQFERSEVHGLLEIF